MTTATHGWVRLNERLGQAQDWFCDMYRLTEIFAATAGERMMDDLKEVRAHMIRPNYQLPTDASETPRNIGPNVAAERERPKGQLLNFGRF